VSEAVTQDGGVDSGADTGIDATVVDAALDAPTDTAAPPACNPSKPFDPPVQIMDFPESITGLTMTSDLLTAYFSAKDVDGGPGGYDIFSATRGSPQGSFGAPKLVPIISTGKDEEHPSLTKDGLLIVLDADFLTRDLRQATRISPVSDFQPHQDIPSVNANVAADYTPWISSDGLTIFFATGRDLGKLTEIYKATRPMPSAAFTTVPVPELNTDSVEVAPVLTSDMLQIFFQSNRAPSQGSDIWMATRASVGDAFQKPIRSATLSSPTRDTPLYITPDGCTIWLTHSIPTDAAVPDTFTVWRAQRPL
jgi:hypothetical protein